MILYALLFYLTEYFLYFVDIIQRNRNNPKKQLCFLKK